MHYPSIVKNSIFCLNSPTTNGASYDAEMENLGRWGEFSLRHILSSERGLASTFCLFCRLFSEILLKHKSMKIY